MVKAKDLEGPESVKKRGGPGRGSFKMVEAISSEFSFAREVPNG